jgi:hypothetical protein
MLLMKLTAARRKSKLQTAISLSFLESSDFIKWCQDSSTWRMEYDISEPGTGCWVDIVDVSSQCIGLTWLLLFALMINKIKVFLWVKKEEKCCSLIAQWH